MPTNTPVAAVLITSLLRSNQFITDSIMANNTNINTTSVNQATSSNDNHRDAVATPIASTSLQATQTVTNTTTNQQPYQSCYILDHRSNINTTNIITNVAKNQSTSNNFHCESIATLTTSSPPTVDKDPNKVILDRSSWCTPNAFFGRCFLGEKCKCQHIKVNNTQAEKKH